MFVISTAVLYQTMEYLSWMSLYRDLSARSMFLFVKQHLKQLTSAFMFMVLWPIIPHLICDIFFYGALYISPLQASLTVYQRFTTLE
ncbi:bifunctional apoptosis regulator [Plakobranchus ocellatus]|uniref:Bifunctional apoptosis regulator n=1 Tax=Plakobranchus ocellatus TaxID=259542 RepID=A0AAV4BCF4_9GAST|nr:bifunctional apoptosis regulator [Plakobranchus ocellatus]